MISEILSGQTMREYEPEELYEMYRDARDRHSWSDNSLAYDYGETLVANSLQGYSEDDDGNPLDDFASIGEQAISILEEAGYPL